MEVWDAGDVLHYERVDQADCRASYVLGAGDTHAYRFNTDRFGMVVAVEVWCDGLLVSAWERLPSRVPMMCNGVSEKSNR
jgi:hypothetical protein